jgi:hypothetical protein
MNTSNNPPPLLSTYQFLGGHRGGKGSANDKILKKRKETGERGRSKKKGMFPLQKWETATAIAWLSAWLMLTSTRLTPACFAANSASPCNYWER